MNHADKTRLPLSILPQPNEITCGPTCLHAIYRYYGFAIPLEQVIEEVPMLEGGGTLAVNLACHALKNGFSTCIYTYKLQLFDPTWLLPGGPDLRERLRRQLQFKDDPKLHSATESYLNYLDLGGDIRFEDLTGALIRRYLKQGHPILTGLSATYLYHSAREYGEDCEYDDVRGEPTGHFVVLHGYNRTDRTINIADPLRDNPFTEGQKYSASIDRVICSILLGVLTYDANLLIVRPTRKDRTHAKGNSDRRR